MSHAESEEQTASGTTTSSDDIPASERSTSERATSVDGATTDTSATTDANGTEPTTPKSTDAPSDASASKSDAGSVPVQATSHADSGQVTAPAQCAFEISGALSPEMPTVGIVEWSVDLPALTDARVEFTLDDPNAAEVNVGGGGKIAVDGRRALLLGLKPGRSYTYRIVATSGETECTSPEHQLVTAFDPAAPTVTRVFGASASPRAIGFVVVTAYNGEHVKIFDADGAVVWWSPSPSGCSRALMDWDGEYMWMMRANAATRGAPSGGEVWRVRMDGSEREPIAGFEYSHHDFAVLPNGATAFLLGEAGAPDSLSFLVERADNGRLTPVAALDGELFGRTSDNYHANALRYYAQDDTYTVSDLSAGTIVKLSRQGQRIWSTGLPCDESPAQCLPVQTYGSHGHQVLQNGNLLFFGVSEPQSEHAAYEYSINREGLMPTATLDWSYAPGLQSIVLGDVQRLPNGNTLVTFSLASTIHEVSPEGELVQSFKDGTFGYTHFRTRLYGPPQ